jgi:hypothetical protein
MNLGCGTLRLVMVGVEELLAKLMRAHTLGAILNILKGAVHPEKAALSPHYS